MEATSIPFGKVDKGQSLWLPARLLPIHLASCYHYEFFHLADQTNEWTSVADGAPTVANASDLNGVVNIMTDATASFENIFCTKYPHWKAQADKRLSVQARVKCDFTAGQAPSLLVGLGSSVAANLLDDDGAGPLDSTYDGAFLYVTETGGVADTEWSFVGSNGGVDTPTTLGTFADNTWDVVGFDYDPYDGTTGKLHPYVSHDGGRILFGTPHDITISGLDAMMYAILALKNSSEDAVAQTFKADYITVYQER